MSKTFGGGGGGKLPPCPPSPTPLRHTFDHLQFLAAIKAGFHHMYVFRLFECFHSMLVPNYSSL